ncbi:putative polysaccharide biosynthesis protein [Natronincola ferrireducens]|uniref:putative polysaccharide biosynthesis protein n=1 Tax=Natronincola ferrireducens TaxID=393762 RepID=UPI0015A473FC|nr:polysaccharide biosynthesis protein [Natronincola ferrireducens]
MKKKGFVYGSILLTFVNFLIRFIGFSYDVILSKLMGAEGIGLFQMMMPVLMIFLIITTAGIPTAVSKLIAEYSSKNNYDAVRKTYRVAVFFTLSLSIGLSLILISFRGFIGLRIFKNEDALRCIYFLPPALVLISITSVMRGYYYGLKMIGIASISEIVEHFTRFVIVIGLLYSIYPLDPILGAFIAICGISIGEFFDLVWLLFMQSRFTKRLPYTIPTSIKMTQLLRQILTISAPLTLSGLFHVILQFTNAILIPQRLMASGYTYSEAIATFGRVMGMAMPLTYLPYFVTSALVINIIPNLSEQVFVKNYKTAKNNIHLAIKITLLVSIPLTALYVFFSKPLAVYLYSDPKASESIYLLGFCTIFLAIQHTFSGILYGLGKQKNTTIHRMIGMSLQFAAVYYLVGNPSYGIYGYYTGFFLCTLSICILDFYTLWKMIKMKYQYTDLFIKPFFAAALMIILILQTQQWFLSINFHLSTSFIYSLIIGGLGYILVLFITKAVPRNLLGMLFRINK